MFCSRCGTENANDAKFCVMCGQPSMTSSTTNKEVQTSVPPNNSAKTSSSFGAKVKVYFKKERGPQEKVDKAAVVGLIGCILACMLSIGGPVRLISVTASSSSGAYKVMLTPLHLMADTPLSSLNSDSTLSSVVKAINAVQEGVAGWSFVAVLVLILSIAGIIFFIHKIRQPRADTLQLNNLVRVFVLLLALFCLSLSIAFSLDWALFPSSFFSQTSSLLFLSDTSNAVGVDYAVASVLLLISYGMSRAKRPSQINSQMQSVITKG